MSYRCDRTVGVLKSPSFNEIDENGNWVPKEGVFYDKTPIDTRKDKVRLLQAILDANPHLHYSWETAEDYMWDLESAAPDIAARMQEHMIDMLELINTGWTFDEAEYYNPYWQMTKEEFGEYSEKMNREFKL